MFNYIQNIFGLSQKEPSNSNIKPIKLYFDKLKTIFLEIKVNNKHTCESLHMEYHNDLGKKIAEISLKNTTDRKYTISKTNYSFYAIDDANKLTTIHLKLLDKPWNYLTIPTVSLYYLDEISKGYQPQDNMPNESYDVLKLNVNRANPEDCIREGILSKYSNKQKKFVERMVLLYKDQLLITKIKENANVKVMLLSDIASVKKGSEERKMNGRYMFQIRTKENDITVFNSNNMTDMECWINAILNQVNIIRENMFFVCYSKDMNEMIKSVYRDSMIIITNQLNTLNGVLSIKESRSLFLKHLSNPLLASLINDIINYQISVSESNYQSAKRAFISFNKSLLIEEYNLAIYFEDDNTNQNQSTIRNEKGIEKTTILYQNINIETRLIGIKEMNLPLLIKSVMPYKTIFQFKEIINELKKIPDSQYKLLSQHLKPHLFNEVFDKIVKILKISFKEINSNRSFIIGIEALLWYYYQKRDTFTKSKLMTFDVLCIK